MTDPVFQSFKDNLLGAFTSDVYLRDYTHAAKTFIPNKFSNAPKVKFLFHVAFNINSNAWKPAQALNTGVLVKNVKLPSFRFDTDILNQYNRKRIIQSKIKYEPAEIVFHDDNASQITAMWNAYYRYYYADSWNPNLTKGAKKRYNRRNIYDASLTDDMQYGYRGDSMKIDDRAGEKAAFFDDITVYGLWNNNYIAYTFINPIITNFSHDTYAYAEADGTMSNTMTIDYETVTYNTGVFSLTDDKVTNTVSGTAAGNPIPGYALQAHYDYTESPNEDLGFNNTLGGIDDMFSLLGGDGSIGDKIKAGAQFANNFDKDKIIANATNAVKDGLKDAILSSITGGLFGGGDDKTSVPTRATSGGMVNISNQGGVTGARNGPGGTDEAAAAVAGQQNFGASVKSNVLRNLGFGG